VAGAQRAERQASGQARAPEQHDNHQPVEHARQCPPIRKTAHTVKTRAGSQCCSSGPSRSRVRHFPYGTAALSDDYFADASTAGLDGCSVSPRCSVPEQVEPQLPSPRGGHPGRVGSRIWAWSTGLYLRLRWICRRLHRMHPFRHPNPRPWRDSAMHLEGRTRSYAASEWASAHINVTWVELLAGRTCRLAAHARPRLLLEGDADPGLLDLCHGATGRHSDMTVGMTWARPFGSSAPVAACCAFA